MSRSRNGVTRPSRSGRPENRILRQVAVAVVVALVATSAVAATVTVAGASTAPAPTDGPPTLAVAAAGTTDAPTHQPSVATALRSTSTPSSTATSAAATGSTGETTANPDAVDVVFVFDRSDSMNDDRYQLANEMESFQQALVERGVDARFGLVTYTADADVRQPLTDDWDAVEEAMHFEPNGNTERASDAVQTAMGMDFREDAETVVVLVTDEDDDSSAETRAAALDDLEDVTFVTISPEDPGVSGCDVHSPPCDNETDNELKTYAERVDGTWVGIESTAEHSMDRVAETVIGTTAAGSGGDGDDGSSGPLSGLENGPDLEAVDRSANRTTVEVGDPIAFDVTVENDGAVEGTFDAYLSTNGEILQRDELVVPRFGENSTTLVHSFDEPGVYTVVLSHERVTNVEVRPKESTSVEVLERPDRDRLLASVTDARTERPVRVDLNESTLVSASGTQLESVAVTPAAGVANPAHDVAFELEMERLTAPPEGTPELSTDARSISYLSVDSTLVSEDLSWVAFEYASTAENVTMYRYDAASEEWVALEQQPIDGVERNVVATTERLSTFAIAVEDPALQVESASVDATDVTGGDEVTATVEVSNDATETRTYDATIALDGDVVATESVDVPAGETVETSLTFAPENAGEYDLSVAGTDQGTLSVSEAATTTTQTTTDDDETTDADDATTATTADATTTTASTPDDATPGFTPALAVLALVALALLATRRR